jgi:hypothetical protein
LVTGRLKALVEQGIPLGVSPGAQSAAKKPGVRRRNDG